MTALHRSFRDDCRATAAMEFSLVLPLMLTLFAGTVEFGRWFQAFDNVNRLATRYASVYADCNDNPANQSPSPRNCNAELALYWPAAAIANVAPQLSNGTASVRLFQVQYNSDGSSAVIYSYPANATPTAAETSAGTAAIYTNWAQQTGVIVTVQYNFVPIFFPQIFSQLVPHATLNLSYTVAQRKT